MKLLVKLILLIIVVIGFTQCSSAQKLEKEAPFKIGKVYFQSWVAGVKGGGSGINIFIPIESISQNKIELDSVYFRGHSSILETKFNRPDFFIGRFSTATNQQRDLIMSNEPYAEYRNVEPQINTKIPFKLKDDECIVSYIEGNMTKYFLIENVVEEKPVHYPSRPPNRQ
ncbi:MAG: hypothetical protein HKO81_04265 [Flavobacteriaceae bacterium]|nr:hypothetical protein [Bacteroidia bacterium]NNL15840.1 hypothetical protein [Flavobacteriaceae bacterium]